VSAAVKTRRKLSPWDRERKRRNNLSNQDWADALRGAGDYSAYEFSLGPNPAVNFIDQLTHTGDFAGQPFQLELWQEAILRLIFDAGGMPRYRYVFIGLARKNGKTEIVGAIVTYMLFGTGIKAQNIYSGSGDADQAGLIHKAAAAMIQANEELSAVSRVYKGNIKRILFEPLGSEYKALSSEAYSKFGLRPSVNLFDEVHVFPNEDLHTALETAYGATRRPFTIYITTAGWDRTSLCWRLWQRARLAQANPKSDPRFLSILYEFREGDDWKDPAVWERINPGLKAFGNIEEFQGKFDDAIRSPLEENTFRQYRLNQWTEQESRWLSLDEWLQCAGEVDPAQMIGEPCYAGFDGAKTGDMAALWLVWPSATGIKCAGRCWAPRDGKWRDEPRNKDRYELWAKEGFLHFTPGTSIDEAIIEREIIERHEQFTFLKIMADRAYYTRMLNNLFNEAMIPVEALPQTAVHLNEPCVTLERMILERTIEHGNNPILNWNVQNASIVRQTTGLIRPNKSSTTERIDGLAALLNALVGYIEDEEQRGALIYEHKGQLAL
jgi:phage terminase large subunit-like protein